MEFSQVQNSLYVQALRSPILAALLHGTRVVGVSQTLRRGTRNGITNFRRGRHLYSAGRLSRWASVHILVVEVLHNWYSKISVAVRWHNVLSKSFAVYSGVRQGSCLSPTIFNVFINAFIIHLRLLDVSCHIGTQYTGCYSMPMT